MQPDIGAPSTRTALSGDSTCHKVMIRLRETRRRIVRPLTDEFHRGSRKEAAGAFKVSDAQSDVVNADCGRADRPCEISYHVMEMDSGSSPFRRGSASPTSWFCRPSDGRAVAP